MAEWNRDTVGYGTGVARTAAEVDQGLRAFMLGVYNHMTTGLAISGVVALALYQFAVTDSAVGAAGKLGDSVFLTSFGMTLYHSPLLYVLIFAPLAFIFVAGRRMMTMSPAAARMTFWAFAAVMGASFSTIFLVYKLGSIVQVFFITAASFGALSLYGYTTKRSLSGWGSFLLMGAAGICLAIIVSIVLAAFGIPIAGLQFAISILGVLIFAGLTAYETQQLKEMYVYGNYGPDDAARASIFGALNLYLDFINMFQFLLMLIGDRR